MSVRIGVESTFLDFVWNIKKNETVSRTLSHRRSPMVDGQQTFHLSICVDDNVNCTTWTCPAAAKGTLSDHMSVLSVFKFAILSCGKFFSIFLFHVCDLVPNVRMKFIKCRKTFLFFSHIVLFWMCKIWKNFHKITKNFHSPLFWQILDKGATVSGEEWKPSKFK